MYIAIAYSVTYIYVCMGRTFLSLNILWYIVHYCMYIPMHTRENAKSNYICGV